MDRIAVVSDLHACSSVGLCPPKVNLDDGGTYIHSPFQKAVWQNWLDFWQRFYALDGTKYVVFNGDTLDRELGQSITNNEADMLKLTMAATEPARRANTTIFQVRGTGYHVGPAAYAEEEFATLINAEKCPDTGTHSWWHLRMEMQKVQLDIAHHTNIGGLPWTSVNPLLRLIFEIQIDNQRNGIPLPNLVARGHVHQYVDTKDLHPTTRVWTTPAWQLKTAYGFRRVPNKITEFGGSIISIDNGNYSVEQIIYRAKKEVVWKPNAKS